MTLTFHICFQCSQQHTYHTYSCHSFQLAVSADMKQRTDWLVPAEDMHMVCSHLPLHGEGHHSNQADMCHSFLPL